MKNHTLDYLCWIPILGVFVEFARTLLLEPYLCDMSNPKRWIASMVWHAIWLAAASGI